MSTQQIAFKIIVIVVIQGAAAYLIGVTLTNKVDPRKWITKPLKAILPMDKPSDGEKLDHLQKSSDEIKEDVNDVEGKVDELPKVICEKVLTALQQAKIIKESNNAEKPHKKRLEEQYELGYTLLHADGAQLSWIPAEMKGKLNWSAIKVTSVSEEAIDIRVSNIRVGGAVLGDNTVGIQRKVGAKARVLVLDHGNSHLELVQECLEVSGDTTIIVLGLTANDSEQ